jgi:cephalosporin hydroxylase
MRALTPLCELAIKHQSDKGGRHLTYGGGTCHATHEYTPIYWDLMHKQKDMVKSVLEIGVNRGCSLRMWEEFFPNAQIVGLDIEPSALVHGGGRIQCFHADQNDPHSLTKALDIAGQHPYDLIIDDGSHLMHHQAISLATLLPYLSDTGAYVVEDIPRDQGWADYLAKSVPPGYNFGIVYPALAAGQGWPEQLFIATREPT